MEHMINPQMGMASAEIMSDLVLICHGAESIKSENKAHNLQMNTYYFLVRWPTSWREAEVSFLSKLFRVCRKNLELKKMKYPATVR